MKTKLMLAALALMITSGAAIGQGTYDMMFTKEQGNAIKVTAIANFAGTHNRCPRFQVIEEATRAELTEAGVTLEMLRMLRGAENGPFVTSILNDYNEDPSKFCGHAWEALGPNGSYKRQLLEAK